MAPELKLKDPGKPKIDWKAYNFSIKIKQYTTQSYKLTNSNHGG